MNEKKLEERKKMIYGLLCDELYVPYAHQRDRYAFRYPKEQTSGSTGSAGCSGRGGQSPGIKKKASTRRQKKW